MQYSICSVKEKALDRNRSKPSSDQNETCEFTFPKIKTWDTRPRQIYCIQNYFKRFLHGDFDRLRHGKLTHSPPRKPEKVSKDIESDLIKK